MDLNLLVEQAQVFFLVFARIMALLMVSPILSSNSIPPLARGALGLFSAAGVTPLVAGVSYVVPETGLAYLFILVGEVLIGLIMGLFLQLIFAAIQTAGQMFSIQMGFGASQTFDPLSQVQIPLIGQFLNLVGLYVFLTVGGLQKIFLYGVSRSFQTITAYDVIRYDTFLQDIFLRALGGLFEQALIIAFPMIGILLLISVTMGLLGKAAPSMNLLMVGFPIQISVGFMIMFFAMPFLIEKMASLVEWGFRFIMDFLEHYGAQGGTV